MEGRAMALPEQELRRASDRIGATALSRMRWFLNFVQLDFDALTEGDQLNQLLEYRAFCSPIRWRSHDGNKRRWTLRSGPQPTIDMLRRAQAPWRKLVDDVRLLKVGGELVLPSHTVNWVIRRNEM